MAVLDNHSWQYAQAGKTLIRLSGRVFCHPESWIFLNNRSEETGTPQWVTNALEVRNVIVLLTVVAGRLRTFFYISDNFLYFLFNIDDQVSH